LITQQTVSDIGLVIHLIKIMGSLSQTQQTKQLYMMFGNQMNQFIYGYGLI